MLISHSGFRAFNEYELSTTLNTQLAQLREEVKQLIKSGDTSKILILEERYKLTPLKFDNEKLTVSSSTANIPAEYFPNGFLVRSGNSYQKEVLKFHLPFVGDPSLLRCVPSTRILYTEEIGIENNSVIFELIKFYDDVDKMRQEKDRMVNFLVKQGANINIEIQEYNNKISQVIREAEQNTRSQMSKHEDFLSELGVPMTPPVPTVKVDRVEEMEGIEKKSQTFDVFICHASEDKDFVEKLAVSLANSQVSVWYDDFQIGWGDDLRPAIDDGLKNSRYGIVVFSKAFLKKKKWTDYELNGLFSREKDGKKVILPIWHNITKEDVSQYSPTFADRVAKMSDDIDSIVKELKNIL